MQTFTIGRGNDLVCAAIDHLAPLIIGTDLETLTADWGKTWRYLTSDSQLRWVGPEKGVIHLALGAVVNALWDLWAKTLGKPVWKVIADMTPEEVVRCIDFRYITDALTPDEAIELLRKNQHGKSERINEALSNRVVPAYTTSAGWLGYSEEKMKRLLQQSVDGGFRYFKLKVGTNLDEDAKRLSIAREVLGFDRGNTLMVDANQVRYMFIDDCCQSCPDSVYRYGLYQKQLPTCRLLPNSSPGLLRNRPLLTIFLDTQPYERHSRIHHTVPLG